MQEPPAKRSRSSWVGGGLAATVLLAVGASLSGCSASTVGLTRAATSTTRAAPVTSSTSTSDPVASPPIELAQVTIVLAVSAVQFKFAGRVVTGPLDVTGLTLDSDQTGFAFTVTGVDYTAAGSTIPGAPDGLITAVTVSASAAGLLVHIGLRRAGSSPHFTVTGDQVAVAVS